MHGGFEQELSTFRKLNLRSSTVADLVMHPASGWNPFDRHRERAPVAPSEGLELGEIPGVFLLISPVTLLILISNISQLILLMDLTE